MNCRKCGIELNENNTYKSIMGMCKNCKIQYTKDHPPTKQQRKRYRNSEKEHIKKYEKEWYLKHKEEVNEKSKISHRKYIQTHREEEKERQKKFRNSPMGREAKRKSRAKRRDMGYIPMNEPFENSAGHHLDDEFIIYIPDILHRSIPHNHFTGKNMELINTKALEWLTEQIKLSK